MGKTADHGHVSECLVYNSEICKQIQISASGAQSGGSCLQWILFRTILRYSEAVGLG